MANDTVARLGQVNGSGDAQATFLKVATGEIITAFEQNTVVKDRVMVRQITSGKSAQFPRMGRFTASYHTPGNEIQGTDTNKAEVVININDLLIADASLANLDEAMSSYDYRAPITAELGRALATQWDKHLLQLGVIAARATNVVTGLPGGSVIHTDSTGAPASADYINNGAHLASALFLAAEQMDNNSVPQDERVAFVRPHQYYAMASTVNNINNQWGGQGAFSDGTILRVAGFDIVKTINLPSTDMSAATDVTAGSVNAGASYPYRGAFAHTAALCLHKSALGTVKLLDLATEMEYTVRRQSTLFVGKYAVGHGILRPEGAIEVSQTTIAAGAS